MECGERGSCEKYCASLSAYFQSLGNEPHRAVVESNAGWYWLDDLLTTLGVELVLAHAKYLKAIAYAKVRQGRLQNISTPVAYELHP